MSSPSSQCSHIPWHAGVAAVMYLALQLHHLLLLRLPHDRGRADEDEHAGGVLPPINVARHVRVSEAFSRSSAPPVLGKTMP